MRTLFEPSSGKAAFGAATNRQEAGLDVVAKRRRPQGEMQDAFRLPAIPPSPPTKQGFLESPSGEFRRLSYVWQLDARVRKVV